MSKDQKHLNYINTVNLGSYYTPEIIVNLAYFILQKNVPNIKDFTILDSSCGYGSFLTKKNIAKKLIGVDIDEKAIFDAKKINHDVNFTCQNSLMDVCRKNLAINNDEKLIAVGNPPYNDITSIIRNSIKDVSVQDKIDFNIKKLGNFTKL